MSVSDIALIPSDKLVGLVCFDGSGLSHTAVLANALGIPAVMGTGRLRRLVDDAQIIVDGNNGQVLLNPGDAVLAEYQRLVNDRRALMKQLEKMRDLPAVSRGMVSP